MTRREPRACLARRNWRVCGLPPRRRPRRAARFRGPSWLRNESRKDLEPGDLLHHEDCRYGSRCATCARSSHAEQGRARLRNLATMQRCCQMLRERPANDCRSSARSAVSRGCCEAAALWRCLSWTRFGRKCSEPDRGARAAASGKPFRASKLSKNPLLKTGVVSV
jgi:hypothetical protein